MFGWIKSVTDDRQKIDGIEFLIDNVHKELAPAVIMAADAYDIAWPRKSPLMTQSAYMAVLFQFAHTYGQSISAKDSEIKKGFMKFYEGITQPAYVESETLKELKNPKNQDLLMGANYLCKKILTGSLGFDEREQLMHGVAQMYVGIA